jgi:hypothetical protein
MFVSWRYSPIFWPKFIARRRPEDGGSKHLWNDGKLILDYMVQYPRRQSPSYSPSGTWNLTKFIVIFSVPLGMLLWETAFNKPRIVPSVSFITSYLESSIGRKCKCTFDRSVLYKTQSDVCLFWCVFVCLYRGLEVLSIAARWNNIFHKCYYH